MENRKMYSWRFKQEDKDKWEKKAKKAKLSLTAWIERRLNGRAKDDNDKHLFI